MKTVHYGRCTCPQNKYGEIESNTCVKKRFNVDCPIRGYFILKICSETYRSMFWEKYESLKYYDYEECAQLLNRQIILDGSGIVEYYRPYKDRNSKSLCHQTCTFNVYKNTYISVNLLYLVEFYYNNGYRSSNNILYQIKEGLKSYINNLGEYKKYHTVKAKTITMINKMSCYSQDSQTLTNDIFLQILKLREYETN